MDSSFGNWRSAALSIGLTAVIFGAAIGIAFL
jgi:hypothetical protein